MKYNLEHINKAFESKVRLGIMSILTDGNLASHTRSLEELGYICSSKQFIGRKPNTQFSITPEGRKAFAEHIRALEDFLKNQKL